MRGPVQAGKGPGSTPSPASGSRHQGLGGSAEAHQMCLPSPVSVVPGLVLAQATAREKGQEGQVGLESQKILREPCW